MFPFSFISGGGGGAASIIVNAFKARVIADGGTFEAYRCMVDQINVLLAQPQIVTTFNLRVVADGGTFEAVNCMQTQITDLQNININ
jgi:ABC-type tungstate transport system permease subunit